MSYELPSSPVMQLVSSWDDPATGASLQHHREAEFPVGKVTTRLARGKPYSSRWYADFIIGREFPDYAALLTAFLTLPCPRGEAVRLVMQDWPKAGTLDAIPEPADGGARPVCSVVGNVFATHVLELRWSWHPSRCEPVYLGRAALRKFKSDGLTYVCAALQQRTGRD